MAFLLSSKNVLQYLVAKGICAEEKPGRSKIELKPAKNFNLLVSLPDGHQILVKQEPHNRQGKTAGELLREWQFQKMLQLPDFSKIHAVVSQAIYCDVENSIIIFHYLKEYQDLAYFYSSDNNYSTDIATAIGATLASVHRLTFANQFYQEIFDSGTAAFSDQGFDLILGLKRLSPEIFSYYPEDALKFFALYQRYHSLEQAIAELIHTIQPYCLTHNDLKLNNILLANNWQDIITEKSPAANSMIRLIDWEKSVWGHPANDLGMLIASYLQIWLYGLITSKTIPIQESLRLATTPLELLQPSIAALVNAYFHSFPEIVDHCPNFLHRVVQFSGLALIQGILATLQHDKTFGNTGICMLQVAKTLLCSPEESIQTVFGKTSWELQEFPALHFVN